MIVRKSECCSCNVQQGKEDKTVVGGVGRHVKDQLPACLSDRWVGGREGEKWQR